MSFGVVAASYLSISVPENTYIFNYTNRTALMADGWDFIATHPDSSPRDTEYPPYLNYAPGGLEILVDDENSIYGPTYNATRNMLFHQLPASWTAAELSLEHEPIGNYDTAGMVIYADDDNYVQFTKSFTGDTTPIAYLYREQAGVVYDEQFPTYTPIDIILRLEKSSDIYTAKVSDDNGATWMTVGAVTQALGSPRFGIYVGAAVRSVNLATATIKQVRFET
ncbi:hypothetical protein EYC58_05225 [Candidatus Saccharibacteria bacterium]|nr:MAG: hypothetical protein EYC58_05225 [Candidatus Saccharibacteria bacterium]